MEIGNSNQELRIKNNGKIYLQWGSKWIDILDSEGNPNMKIKNLINSGTPTSSSNNGFYYDGDSIYLKVGDDIIDLSSTQLPEGSIIMYKGTQPPPDSGWYKYGNTDLDGIIYIINKSGETQELAEVTLQWNPSTNPIYTTIGESFTSPVLNKIVSKNVPLIINYTSSDTSKATIDGNGNVTIKAVGQTTIVANTEANSQHKAANASYLLIIQEPATIPVQSISISPTTFELESGSTQQFSATVLPTDATDKTVTWRIVSGPATINQNGVLTINNVTKDTEIVVEASAGGKTTQIRGTAKASNIPVTSISISPTTFEINEGETQQFTTTILPSNATNKSITWSVVNGNATINQNGLLTAGDVSEDSTVVIKATANNGISKTSTGTIKANSQPQPPDQLLYSVGLISDIHYQLPDSQGPLTFAGSAGKSNNGSFYREDLNKIINVFKANNVEFVASPGDIATSSLNEFIHFTRDYIKDFTGITENGNGTNFLNDSNYRKFYCALGNHDHQAVYSDSTACKYFDYSGSAGTHVDGQRWITTASYNCPGALAGSVSYFSSNSKSYKILSSTGDVYIFLSAFYGDGGIDLTGDGRHDNSQIHPHNQMTPDQITDLKSYIQQKYNNGYSFPDNESNFNFQYYKYEDLVELKNIIEANSSKKIFVFSHYFLTNKSGGNNEYPGDGYSGGASTCLMGITFHFLNCLNNIFKNVIWFTGHSHLSWKYGNAKKGLHWTNTNYKYILPTASDNSSIWPRNANNYKYEYFVVTTGNTPYNRLTSEVDSSRPTCGWNVHLPSLSRPIESGGKNLTACEAAIMRVYSDRVEIEKLRYTSSDGVNYTEDTNIPDKILTVYNDGTGECNDTNPEISESTDIPSPNDNQIAFKITNNTDKTAVFTGELSLWYYNNGTSGNSSEAYFSFRNKAKYQNGETTYSYKDSNNNKYYYLSKNENAANGHTCVVYMHENTDKLEPGKSMTIIYSYMLDGSSSSAQVGGDASHKISLNNIVGKYFRTDDSNLATFPNYGVNYDIKWRVQMSRDWPSEPCQNGTWPSGKTRRDVTPNTMIYAKLTDSNKQIQLGRTYNISITDVRDSYTDAGYVRADYIGLPSDRIVDTNLVQVYYGSSSTPDPTPSTDPEGSVDLGTAGVWVNHNVEANSETEYGEYYTYSEALSLAQNTSGYRLPTIEDFQTLWDNSTTEWTTINGVYGQKFTSKSDSSKYIFFPAAGYKAQATGYVLETGQGRYWASTQDSSVNSYNRLLFNSAIHNLNGTQGLEDKLTVRLIKN